VSHRDPDETRALQLIDLVYPHLPVELATGSVDDSWPLTGHALLARLTGTLEAILQLRPLGRVADAIILARSLLDHAVTFAWLAAEPGPERQRRFARSDAVQRLKLDNDCRALGVPILEPEMRAWHEANRAKLPRNMPNLAERAKQADEYWTGKVPGLHTEERLHSYRGFYALMYRHNSGYEHPSALGLLAVAEDLPGDRTRVGLEEAREGDPDPLGLANALYSYSLFIASETIGWPAAADVRAVWNTAPDNLSA
jgi:hypothetical protein